MKKLKIIDLKHEAQFFLKDAYDLHLKIPVERNNRLKSTHGRFVIKNHRAHAIEIAGYVLDYATYDVIYDILKHECIHYALYIKGLPYKDHHNFFKEQLKKHQASPTKTLKIGKLNQYMCHKCHQKILTNHRQLFKNPEKFRTHCCHAKIKYVGYQIFNGHQITYSENL